MPCTMFQDSKDWRSQAQATYKHGQQRGTDPAVYTPIAPAGIRTQMVLLLGQCYMSSNTLMLLCSLQSMQALAEHQTYKSMAVHSK